MRRNPYYRVESFYPSGSFSRYNFSIMLDADFARKALETELSEKGFENLANFGRDMIQGIMNSQPHAIREPYHFVERNGRRSALLRWCRVPGDATEIGIDWRVLSTFESTQVDNYIEYIEYKPHNIDTLGEAFCLFSLWSRWANMVPVLFED